MTRLHKQKTAIVSLSALLVLTVMGRATATLVAPMINPILTQVLGATTFPLPANVPVGTTIRIGGSSSMETINQVLKRRFEQQFVGTEVVLNTQGTGPAIKDLLDGNADLAAIGRSLTEQEKAQGLVPVPVSRHKIAIIVGSENPFKGDLTFEQFAKIFRGEIKDWAQVGGEPGAIRFVDRPDNSDTRQAFRNYPIFKQAPFATGKTVRQLAQDNTSQVVQALRTDGIGYAIADQLEGRGDVRVISMHKTLPSNPKYPFSQPLIYVYKGPQPNPSAQAFLGFATAPTSRQTIETARKEASAVADATPAIASPRPQVSLPSPQAAAPTPTPPTTTPSFPDAASTATARLFPWWLLLALPLLGWLFWWLLKGRESQLEPEGTLPELRSELPETLVPLGETIALASVVPEVTAPLLETARSTGNSRLILVPQSCTDAYAYWEIPDDANVALQQQGAQKLVLRLYDVTAVALDHQPPVSLQEFDCDAQAQDRHLPIRTDDRDYLAELGYVAADGRWLQVARSQTVRVPACPPKQMIAPETETSERASPEPFDDAVKTGGAALAGDIAAGDIAAGDIAAGDIAAGDIAADGVISTDDTVARPMMAGDRSSLPLSTEGNRIDEDSRIEDSRIEDSRIILVPRNQTDVYAYWEVSDDIKEARRQQGGQTLALRLYDVTEGIHVDQQALPFQQFDANETVCDQHLPIAVADHTYAVELGYVTGDDRWLKLTRSSPVRVSSSKPAVALVSDHTNNMAVTSKETVQADSKPPGSVAAMTTPVSGDVAGLAHDRTLEDSHSPSQSQVFLVPRSGQSAYIYWDVTQADKDALKHQGGQQLMLRVYDVTSTDTPSVHCIQQFLCNEWDCDQQVPIPVSNLDYVAELGYATLDGRFLSLARSPYTRVPGA